VPVTVVIHGNLVSLIVIVSTSGHRAEAIEATSYAIEEVKRISLVGPRLGWHDSKDSSKGPMNDITVCNFGII
jgi:hypothetical protein